MREKLIEILETVAYPEVLCDGEVLVSTARVADHLIANGVTIPVRCKDCKSWDQKQCADGYGWCDKVSAFKPGEWYCADGVNKND